MFADIRRYNALIDNCSVLTHPYVNSTPMDLTKKTNEPTTAPNYFLAPEICLIPNSI